MFYFKLIALFNNSILAVLKWFFSFWHRKIIKMCSDKDVIFVIGQPSKQRLSKWLEDTFEIKDENLNESSFHVKIRNKTVEINIEFCNFNRISFDENKFVTFCQKEESNIKAIISIQNCNPRPQTIVENISKLRRVFTAKDLKKKLYIFAITDENKEEIGNRILSDNLGFNNLLELDKIIPKIKQNF